MKKRLANQIIPFCFLIISIILCSAFPGNDPLYAADSSDLDLSQTKPGHVSAGISEGPHQLGSGKVYYSDCNSYGPTTPFYEYDVATDIWTERASIPNANTTQLAVDDKGRVYSLPEDGKIYQYMPDTDTWEYVMNGPPESVGRNGISLFIAHDGAFYWGTDDEYTLHYTVAGVWSAKETPKPVSSGATVDRNSGLIYIRIFRDLGFMVFDPASATFPKVCEVGTGVFENSRVGAYFNGEFFTRNNYETYQAIDVSTCSAVDWHGLIPKKCHDIVPGKNEVEPGSSQLPGSV